VLKTRWSLVGMSFLLVATSCCGHRYNRAEVNAEALADEVIRARALGYFVPSHGPPLDEAVFDVVFDGSNGCPVAQASKDSQNCLNAVNNQKCTAIRRRHTKPGMKTKVTFRAADPTKRYYVYFEPFGTKAGEEKEHGSDSKGEVTFEVDPGLIVNDGSAPESYWKYSLFGASRQCWSSPDDPNVIVGN
jgi:hypothetical protein